MRNPRTHPAQPRQQPIGEGAAAERLQIARRPHPPDETDRDPEFFPHREHHRRPLRSRRSSSARRRRFSHQMFTVVNSLVDSLLAVVYPQPCHICGSSVDASADGVASAACWEKTRMFTGEETLCGKCGAFLGTVGSAHRSNVRKVQRPPLRQSFCGRHL